MTSPDSAVSPRVPPRETPRATPRAIALALAAGAGGGWAAHLLGVPLAWMLGALAATVLVVAAGGSPALPPLIRRIVLAVIGAYLGAGLSPAAFETLGVLVLSLLWLALYVVTVIFLARFLFLRFLPVNQRTAICAAIPGAFSLTVALAEEKGDEFTVTVIQTLRLVLTIITLPLLARFFLADDGGDAARAAGGALAAAAGGDEYGGAANSGLASAAIFFALVLPPAFAGWVFKWRAPVILSVSVVLSSALYLSLAPLPPLPGAPINIALMLLGTSVGCSFLLFRGAPLARVFAVGGGVSLLIIALAALFAAAGAPLLQVPFWTLLLALAPGGISEISLIALALDINPTYVTLHQLLRIIALILIAPFMVVWVEQFAAKRGARA